MVLRHRQNWFWWAIHTQAICFYSADGVAIRSRCSGGIAKGLSANTVSRLKGEWAKEYDGLRAADLDDEPIVYIWADGVHNGLRGENDKLCALVIVGVTARGQKRLLAIEDGVREPKQSWREGLLNHKSRGMNAPKRAIGDGAMGFWAAMDEVYPTTRHHYPLLALLMTQPIPLTNSQFLKISGWIMNVCPRIDFVAVVEKNRLTTSLTRAEYGRSVR